jgi:hypothetical protein
MKVYSARFADLFADKVVLEDRRGKGHNNWRTIISISL